MAGVETSNTPSRREALAAFLVLVAIFSCGVGLYVTFFGGDALGGMTCIWLGGMMFAIRGALP